MMVELNLRVSSEKQEVKDTLEELTTEKDKSVVAKTLEMLCQVI